MREIGYRAWLKEEKRFIYPKLILNDFGSVVEVAYDDIDMLTDELIEHRLIIEDVVLEQFTGLRDKNRKRIYEGDIIKSYDGSDAEKNDNYAVTEVRWDDFYTGFYPMNRDENADFNRGLCEVIGNIHENPELLKG